MKNYEIKDRKIIIKYEITEESTKNDPFYLQNLMYDLPFETSDIESLYIQIIIPENFAAYLIDDLHFVSTTKNRIEFFLQESSLLTYRLFVANHDLCNLCDKKEFFGCQKLPQVFEKKIDINLLGTGSQAYINSHYLGDNESFFKIITNQNHKAPNTISKLIVKSVLDGQAKLVCDNTITVDKNLEKVTCEQMNKNLVLGKNDQKPHVISIPKLKIDSDSTSCKHGATVSSINQEELFYLQSRGIDKIEAERMLIEAFLR